MSLSKLAILPNSILVYALVTLLGIFNKPVYLTLCASILFRKNRKECKLKNVVFCNIDSPLFMRFLLDVKYVKYLEVWKFVI
jgi:hypothetical protein